MQGYVDAGILKPVISSYGNTKGDIKPTYTFNGWTAPADQNSFYEFKPDGSYLATTGYGGAHGAILQAAQYLPSAVMSLGLNFITAGAASAIGGTLVSSGVVTSTAVANAIGAATINAGVQIASGIPPETAIKNAVISTAASQYISPEISKEVKSVITDSPAVAAAVTNMGTNIATGVLQGKSQDELLNSAVAAGTSAVVNTVANDIVANTPGLNAPDLPPELKQIALAGITGALTTGDGTKAMVNAAVQQGTKAVLDSASDDLHPETVLKLQDSHDTAATPAVDTATLASVTTPDEPDTSDLSSYIAELQRANTAPTDTDGGEGRTTPEYTLPYDTSPIDTNYGLSSNSTPTLDDMGGGTGLTATPSTSTDPEDYLSTLLPPAEGMGGGTGLTLPTVPSDSSMGGGTGLTVPVEGGTMTGSGFVSDAYTPSLGDPSSFINGGTSGLTTTPTKTITPTTTTPTKTTTPAAEPIAATVNNYYPAPTDIHANTIATAGTGFNVEDPFNASWFSDYQRAHKPTKIASGGYLDRLLEQPTSFEDLLRTLRN
jgi:hypothetical protein